MPTLPFDLVGVAVLVTTNFVELSWISFAKPVQLIVAIPSTSKSTLASFTMASGILYSKGFEVAVSIKKNKVNECKADLLDSPIVTTEESVPAVITLASAPPTGCTFRTKLLARVLSAPNIDAHRTSSTA